MNGNRLARWAPVLVLLALCVALALINPNFLSARNIARVLTGAVGPLMVAVGVSYVIVMGSIDLSMEGTIALSGAVFALLLPALGGFGAWGWLAVPVVLALATLLGVVNGMLHVGLRIPSFLASLGMGFVGVGATMLLTGGTRIPARDPVYRVILTERWLGFPIMVYLAALALAFAWFIQRYTVLGRHLYAVGGGEALAAAAGLDVRRIRVQAFALAGFFFGLGALFLVARFGSVSSGLGSGQMFVAITSVVVGGTSLIGGGGGVLHTLVGVLIVAVIGNGMVLLGLPSHIQQGVLGAMVILAAALAVDRRRAELVK